MNLFLLAHNGVAWNAFERGDMNRISFRLAASAALLILLSGIVGCSFGGANQLSDGKASQTYGDADDVIDNADNLREDFKSGDVEMDESTKGADITLLG